MAAPSPADDAPLRFAGARVTGAVQPLGAMLDGVRFDLGGGREVIPLVTAPWAAEADAPADLPGIMRRLRGEWPCVPFGMPAPPEGLPADWRVGSGGPVDPEPHGHGSNRPWRLTADGGDGVLAGIDYPQAHPVRRLERTVRASAREAALDLALTVHVRRDADLPVGLHPTFRLPREGALAFARTTRVYSFPVDAEPGRSRFAPDQRGADPAAVGLAGGGTADLRSLPQEGASEDLLLLVGTGGRVALEDRAEGWRATVAWDATALPGCLLWISNGGRAFAPWNGRFRGIGIEPVAAPFDLGTAIAAADNPLARAGVATTVRFRADRPWTTRYRIALDAL